MQFVQNVISTSTAFSYYIHDQLTRRTCEEVRVSYKYQEVDTQKIILNNRYNNLS